MSAMIIGVVLLLLVGLGVGIYFLMNAKTCEDHETQDECKKPCQWDTYGYKCIGEKDAMTPKPPSNDTTSTTSAKTADDAPSTSPTTAAGGDKWKCYAGRYGDAYEEYLKKKSLDDVKGHYETIGKSKGWSTSCTLTPDELGCYTLQNPEVFENFGYTLDSRYKAKQRTHYADVGRDKVARFNCRGGTLAASEIPENASIMTPREISNIDKRNGKYTNLLTSPNGEYTLRLHHETRRARLFLTKGNSNILTILDSQLSQSDYDAGFTNLRAWFSGTDGNLYMRWYRATGSAHKAAVYINTFAPGTTNNQVKSNQQLLVLTDSGKLYIDHGLGDEEQAILHEGDDE